MLEKVTSIFSRKAEATTAQEEPKVPVTIGGIVTMVPKSQVGTFTKEQRDAA